MSDVTITKETFHQCESIRQEGSYNMMDSAVADQLGLDKEEHIYLLKNYGNLLKKYGEGNE